MKLLALPIHPLFVYDGRHKPPFKRGKAVSARSYGNAPIIRRSKDLIERFRFPWHEAPGEAEAECARLQQAGVVDAVMTNDVDALMFGSTFTIMNFSKESGTSTSASTHVTCYSMGREGHVSNVPLDRAGMILFAMLSGGDYLPSGVPKCGSKLAAQIAKAKFGDDLLKEITSPLPDLDSRLNEWRDRLQYELEENESGWFTTKHKAVRIPENFPDRTILKYYAEPEVSSEDEMAALRRRLMHAWDREIDPLAIRNFAAEHFEWNYRSGARKVIKLLAEPLVSYRLRLQRPVSGLQHGTLSPNCDTPWLQNVYKSRANFGTDGITELQMDMLPIDVVGLDLFAEEPNPPLLSEDPQPSQGTLPSGDEEDEAEIAAEAPPPTPSKTRVARSYDPLAIEKVWVFETIARIGAPEIVKKWDDEQAAKANKAAAKKPRSRQTGPKKKGPIDPGMKRGSILKYGTLTKDKSDLSSTTKAHLREAAKDRRSPFPDTHSYPEVIDLETDSLSPSMYSQLQPTSQTGYDLHEVNELIDSFSSLSTASATPSIKRHPMARQGRLWPRIGASTTGEVGIEMSISPFDETVALPPSTARPAIKMSYSVSGRGRSTAAHSKKITSQIEPSPTNLPSPTKRKGRRSAKKLDRTANTTVISDEVHELEEAIDSLRLSTALDDDFHGSRVRSLRRPTTSILQQRDVSGSKPKSCKAEPSSIVGKPAWREDLLSSTDDHTTMFENQCDGSTKKASTKKDCKRASPISRPSKETEERTPEQRQTIGHVENITISNGFWDVDSSPEYVEAASSTAHHPDDSTETGHEDRGKKKRVPRVSILELI